MKNKATWIWYPGDFEVWLGNKFNNRRTERGAMFPPFWKQDSHWPTVVFTKAVDLVEPETVTIITEGQTNLSIDGKLMPVGPVRPLSLTVPAGEHTLALKVWNQATPPALFLDGETIKSDDSWQVTYEDKIWIDENGEAHGSGIYVPVGCWNLDESGTPPSQFRLPTKPLRPVCSWTSQAAKPSGDSVATNGTNATLYDFGRETFGYLRIHGLKGTVRIYYGESREEALDKDHCETLDILSEGGQLGSKAFRFVLIEKESGAAYDDVTMDYECAPFSPEKSGTFRCSDDELNHIWEVAAYTLELTTQEFFMDGIKRDRWVWSGDAAQSYLMNYYLHFDTECVKRTIRQLRGKDPVTAHVNTIMDYTFYWFISIDQYYEFTGDKAFLKEIYPKMLTLMEYVESRLDKEGRLEAQPDDWVFVDWTDFPMPKRGILAFEEILYEKSLRIMFLTVFRVSHGLSECIEWLKKARKHTELLTEKFWNGNRCSFMHSIEGRETNSLVTRFPNIMAILFNLITLDKKEAILKHVLLNPDVPAITTPYMRFYELEALCKMEQQEKVLKDIKDYWGGMLREGATTFWEKYNPEEKGTEHLAMYGRPYGKSLCHAWGASPIYILGRYFLGVQPTKPGYEEYEVRPVLGGLEWMEGRVPTPFGLIHVKMDATAVTVRSDGGHGTLIVGDRRIDIPAGQKITCKLKA